MTFATASSVGRRPPSRASALATRHRRHPDALAREPPAVWPMLTKELLLGTATLDRLPLHPDEWCTWSRTWTCGTVMEAVEVDAEGQRLWDERGEEIAFGDLLLGDGCRPRRLRAEGRRSPAVRYFRDLEDYLDLESRLDRVQHITIVGGGFTSVEMAGALRARGKGDHARAGRGVPCSPGAAARPRCAAARLPARDGRRDGERRHAGEDRGANGLVRAQCAGNELDTQLVLVDQGGEPSWTWPRPRGSRSTTASSSNSASTMQIRAGRRRGRVPVPGAERDHARRGSDHAEQHGRAVGANMAGACTGLFAPAMFPPTARPCGSAWSRPRRAWSSRSAPGTGTRPRRRRPRCPGWRCARTRPRRCRRRSRARRPRPGPPGARCRWPTSTVWVSVVPLHRARVHEARSAPRTSRACRRSRSRRPARGGSRAAATPRSRGSTR